MCRSSVCNMPHGISYSDHVVLWNAKNEEHHVNISGSLVFLILVLRGNPIDAKRSRGYEAATQIVASVIFANFRVSFSRRGDSLITADQRGVHCIQPLPEALRSSHGWSLTFVHNFELKSSQLFMDWTSKAKSTVTLHFSHLEAWSLLSTLCSRDHHRAKGVNARQASL